MFNVEIMKRNNDVEKKTIIMKKKKLKKKLLQKKGIEQKIKNLENQKKGIEEAGEYERLLGEQQKNLYKLSSEIVDLQTKLGLQSKFNQLFHLAQGLKDIHSKK